MSFSAEMTDGDRALKTGDFGEAYRAFGRAHDAGHAVKRDHLAAHRGMIKAATRAGRLDRAVKNIALMSAAFLFDRDRPVSAAR